MIKVIKLLMVFLGVLKLWAPMKDLNGVKATTITTEVYPMTYGEVAITHAYRTIMKTSDLVSLDYETLDNAFFFGHVMDAYNLYNGYTIPSNMNIMNLHSSFLAHINLYTG